jgi:putative SOS response-associated peptidase YedK
MCGRYYVDIDEKDFRDIIASVERNAAARDETIAFKGGEIFPTNAVPVITAAETRFMVWGFPCHDGKKPLINARSETAASTRMFKESFAARRCVVPATSYFEWKRLNKRTNQKYEFKLPDKSTLYMAGIYSPDGCFSILTRPASLSISEIHDRMPVILPRHLTVAWLNEAPDVMGDALTELLFVQSDSHQQGQSRQMSLFV